MIFDLSGELCIAASGEHLAALEGSAALQGIGLATLLPVAPDADLPAEALAKAKVLVLEVDPQLPASVRRIGKVRSEHDDLKIIAAIRDADVALVRTLIRQGIADVATLPFDAEDLASQLLDVLTPLRRSSGDQRLAPMVAVIRSSGGCGSTTLITHLAAALAARDGTGRGVCLADIDLQSGAVASFLGLSPKAGIAALIEAGDRLDEQILRSVVTETSHGVSVICAPEEITPLDIVKTEDLSRITALLRQTFGHVLVDLPADWTNWGLSLAADASQILLVTDLSISGLRQARRRLDLLASIGVSPDSIKVVANRMERRFFKTIGVDDVRQALRCEVAVALDDEGAAMRGAQDQGLLIGDAGGRTHYEAQVRELADLLLGKGG